MNLPITKHSCARLDAFPEHNFVTPVTLDTETSFVLIVLLVTTDAR